MHSQWAVMQFIKEAQAFLALFTVCFTCTHGPEAWLASSVGLCKWQNSSLGQVVGVLLGFFCKSSNCEWGDSCQEQIKYSMCMFLSVHVRLCPCASLYHIVTPFLTQEQTLKGSFLYVTSHLHKVRLLYVGVSFPVVSFDFLVYSVCINRQLKRCQIINLLSLWCATDSAILKWISYYDTKKIESSGDETGCVLQQTDDSATPWPNPSH